MRAASRQTRSRSHNCHLSSGAKGPFYVKLLSVRLRPPSRDTKVWLRKEREIRNKISKRDVATHKVQRHATSTPRRASFLGSVIIPPCTSNNERVPPAKKKWHGLRLLQRRLRMRTYRKKQLKGTVHTIPPCSVSPPEPKPRDTNPYVSR